MFKFLKKLSHDDLIGATGTITLLTAYALTTHELVQEQIIIDSMNMYGALAVGYNCWCKRTFPPLALEIAWFTIASVSFVKNVNYKYSKKNK